MPGKGKKPITRDKIAEYAKELRAIAAKLGEIVRQMEETETSVLNAMGQPTANLGLGYFDGLIQSCERELRVINSNRKER